MGKNFDSEARRSARLDHDRSFTINGQELRYRVAVAPEKVTPYYAFKTGETVLTEAEVVKIVDDTISALLEPGQEDAWRAARDPDAEHPVMFGDMIEVVEWILAQMTGRPFGPASGSGDGSAEPTSGTPSTVVSSSPAETG